jgi:hypothetical protein
VLGTKKSNLDNIILNFLIQKYKNYNIQSYNFACLRGCETWSLTLRDKHRLRVSENRVLRKIFGLKRDKVTGE